MKIVVTGAAGLIGWHASCRLHALNCAARFRGEDAPVDLVRLDHAGFEDSAALAKALTGCDAVLHFAGVNRAPDDVVEAANPAIAEALVAGCRAAGVAPHIVYANSTHAVSDTPYGRSKAGAARVLNAFTDRFTDLVLPHIFGEGARPRYNNVTATLIDDLLAGNPAQINPDGAVNLVHAGAAAQRAIDAAMDGEVGQIRPDGRRLSIPALHAKLQGYRDGLAANTYPDVSDPFELALYNSFRWASFPDHWPKALSLNTDPRGTLFEAAKGGGGGQTFVSWTEPGVTRGDHFHIDKIERFLVLQGQAVIRLRRVLDDEVVAFTVSGETPQAIDMPTLWTHSIQNTGDEPLLTLFWAHEIFDPSAPDTYADPVLRG